MHAKTHLVAASTGSVVLWPITMKMLAKLLVAYVEKERERKKHINDIIPDKPHYQLVEFNHMSKSFNENLESNFLL